MNATVTPRGSATFRLYSPDDTQCSWPIFLSTVAVTSTSINSSYFPTSDAGAYRWTATYSGDATYAPSGPTPCTLESADVVVAKARNILKVVALTPTPGTTYGSATISGYHPTGTLTFLLTGPDSQFCAGTPVFSSTVEIDGAGTYTSAGFSPSAPGTYTWRVSYGGDEDNRGSSVTACLASGNTTTIS